MLPPFKQCESRIQCHSYSTFDKFWRYKLNVESRGGSILDDSHLDETVMRLVKNLLLHDEWQLWQTGVASLQRIEKILKNNRNAYNNIKDVELGDGQIANQSMSNALSRIYAGFYVATEQCGMTHNCWNNDSPNGGGRYYILGRSKVMMFIWGQTPGFDTWVRERLGKAGLGSSCPWVGEKRWTPSEFCDTLKQLDRWVATWEKQEGRKFRQCLSRNRPVGRIIDMIYWGQ